MEAAAGDWGSVSWGFKKKSIFNSPFSSPFQPLADLLADPEMILGTRALVLTVPSAGNDIPSMVLTPLPHRSPSQ